MNKLKPYLLASPAILFVSFFSFCILVSTIEFGTKYAGEFSFRGFTGIFKDPNLFIYLRNSFIMGFFPILLTVLLSYALILCISKLKYRSLKLLAISILAIPMFMPTTTFLMLFNNLIPSPYQASCPRIFVYIETSFPLVFSLYTLEGTIRDIAIPVILGVLVCQASGDFNKKGVLYALAIYALVRCTMLLSPDLNLQINSVRSWIRIEAETLDFNIFRNFESNFTRDISIASALTLLQTALQIPISIIATIAVFKLSKHLKPPAEFIETDKQGKLSIKAIIGFLLLSVGSIAVIFCVFGPKFIQSELLTITHQGINYRDMEEIMDFMFKALSDSLIRGLMGALIFAVISILLAYPLLKRNKFYFAFLAAIAIIPFSLPAMHQIFDRLGILNTGWSVILPYVYSTFGAFAVYYSLYNKFATETPSLRRYLKAAWPSAAVVGFIAFIRIFGDFVMSYRFFDLDREIDMGMGYFVIAMAANLKAEPYDIIFGYLTVPTFITISSIIPITMGLVLIWNSKLFPLSAFSAQIRK